MGYKAILYSVDYVILLRVHKSLTEFVLRATYTQNQVQFWSAHTQKNAEAVFPKVTVDYRNINEISL